MPKGEKVKAILFDANGMDREIAPLADVAHIPDKQIYWLIVSGQGAGKLPHPADEIDRAAVRLGGVVVSDDRFCFSVPVAPNEGGHSEDAMILVVGRNWLLTCSDAPLSLTERYLEHDTGETLKGSLTAPALAVSLLLAHFDEFHTHLSAIEEKLDTLDEQVFRSRQRHDPLNTLAVLRRRAARLRGLVAQHRSTIAALDRPDFGPAVCEEDRHHLTHLAEAYHRLVDTVDRTRDAVLSSYDLYATRVAQNTNRLLQRLTVITIGVGLIGAIGSIFGMNFNLGLFKAGERPFWITVAVMAVTALVTLFLALRGGRR
ncbi:CorA family divalent cation transporter [Novosphingobium sp.]|uniref:CorA family divalent cation transporter n=1 Tax=Novosphingobium sp. TaxID=1874826 RepID=UPI00286E96FA|nr:CorA family divalent cation transporter [Novosphingobium sp.]